MDENEILAKAADTFIDVPKTVEVMIFPHNRRESLLQRMGLMAKRKVFTIRPVLAGNMVRISGKAVNLPKELWVSEDDSFTDVLGGLAVKHMDDMIYVIAVAIQNDRHEPDKSLLNFIRYRFSAKNMYEVVGTITEQMNQKDFLKSISLIKGMNILRLKESPQETEEIIASGE